MPSFLLRMGRLQRRSPASPMRSSLGATPQPPWHPRWLPAQRRPAATAAPAAAAASRSPWSSSQRPWRSRSSARSMHSVFWHGRRRQRWRSSRASRLAALSPARPWVDVAQRRQWDGTPPGQLQPFPGGWRPIYHPWTGAETLYEMARGAWGGVRRCLSLADNAAQRRVLLDIGCHRGAFTNFGACPPPTKSAPFPSLGAARPAHWRRAPLLYLRTPFFARQAFFALLASQPRLRTATAPVRHQAARVDAGAQYGRGQRMRDFIVGVLKLE